MNSDTDNDNIIALPDSEAERVAYRADRADRQRHRVDAEASSSTPLQLQLTLRRQASREPLRTAREALVDAQTGHSPTHVGAEKRQREREQRGGSSPYSRFASIATRFERKTELPKQASAGSSAIAASASTSKGRRPATKTTHQPLLDLLEVITACPICDTIWTSRKTAAIKETHVGTCARKRKISPTEVQRRIRSSARSAVQSADGSQIATIFETTLEAVQGAAGGVEVVGVEMGAGTLDVVQSEFAVRRRRARQHTLGATKATDKFIRAAAILTDFPSTQTISKLPISVSSGADVAAGAKRLLNTMDMPSATPAFVPSRLASRYTAPASITGGMHEPSAVLPWIAQANDARSVPPALWASLLRYEPIELSVMSSILNADGQGGKLKQQAALQAGLEAQGITFFQEKNRGQGRRRH